MLKIAVLISGGGSNLESIMDSIDNGYLKNISLEYVISDREAKGIEKASARGYKTLVLDRKVYKSILSEKILEVLEGNVDFIVLAGFLSIVDKCLVQNFKDRIINIHPSLIPSFCGAGMYGINVHKAVINKGVKYSGCTVHFVNEGIDEGAIIFQEIVDVLDDDTPEVLQKRILKKEHQILSKALKFISEDKLSINGNRTIIV